MLKSVARVAVLLWLCLLIPAQAQVRHLVILHTNDFHGHLLPFEDKALRAPPGKVGGAAALAGLVRDLRMKFPHALLMDGGDIAQGTPMSNLFFGMPVVEFMNHLHYDARTIGNHEFDWGVPRLEKMIRAATSPIVCANLVRRDNGHLLDGVRPYVVLTVDGVHVGILGLVTPDTPLMSFPDNVKPVRFLDPAATVRRYLPAMRRDGAQMVVLLTHLGVDDDVKLAQQVPQIDVIVGGHSHTPLPVPRLSGHTVIVQAGCYGRYVGVLQVDYDTRLHRVTRHTEKDELAMVQPDQVKPDPVVAAMVARVQAKVGPRLAETVGTLAEDLPVGDGRIGDTPLADVVTDALREETGAMVAVYNFGGIRSPLSQGEVHWGDVYTTLPFENHVVTVSVTGQALLDLLAQSLRRGPDLGLIQVSGLAYAVGPDRRLQAAEVGGIPIDPSKTYTVATIDFLYLGGDGYTALQGAPHPSYGRLARDVLVDYLQRHPDLKAPPGGRIRVLDTAKEAPVQ